MLTDYLVIFAILAVVFAASYVAHKFIARNEQHIEALELAATVRRHEARIAELKRQNNEAWDDWSKLDRSYKQLESNCSATVHAYAQCEADLIVTRGRLTEAADELLTYGVDIRADWDEQADDEQQPDEHVETEPSMFFDNLTAEYKQVNPHIAGDTQTWMMPSADIDAVISDPYRTWSGFTARQLEPARVPAQRDGES